LENGWNGFSRPWSGWAALLSKRMGQAGAKACPSFPRDSSAVLRVKGGVQNAFGQRAPLRPGRRRPSLTGPALPLIHPASLTRTGRTAPFPGHSAASRRQETGMSRTCELTGKKPMVGNKVSHSNIKTKRRYLPNLVDVTVHSEALGQSYSARISASALRTVDKRGGLDAFLAKAKDEELSAKMLKVKKAIAKKASEAAA